MTTSAAAAMTIKADTSPRFQHYASSRRSMRMITEEGKAVIFINFKFITDDEDTIAYLDEEIRKGLRDVTKGELLTSEEADPMAGIKKAAIEEYKQQQAELAKQQALGIEPDMGTTEKTHLNPSSTKQHKGNADGSTSSGAAAK